MWTLIEKELDVYWFLFSNLYFIALLLFSLTIPILIEYVRRFYPQHIHKFEQNSMKIVYLLKFRFDTQPYSNIQSIKKIPQKEHIAITFKDGTIWKSTDYSNRELFTQEGYQKLKKFLESKTDRQVSVEAK